MNVGALNVACVSFPRIPSSERFACSCSYSDFASLQLSNSTNFVLRSSGLQTHRTARRRRCSHVVVSYQSVAAENEAEGNETAPSSSTLDWQKRDRLWQHLQGSLKHWKQELKDRGSLQLAKELLASTETRLRQADANQAFKQKLQELKPPPPSTLWSSIHPAIKWPAVTFGVFYLAVTILCGKIVSDNLWHVWVFGPLAMSFYIQVGIYVGALYRGYAAPLGEAFARRSIQLVSDIRSGKLQQDFRAGFKHLAEQRAAALHYLKTKAAADVKHQVIRFGLWLYEKYEDIIDLLWPSWRLFIRSLANLF